MRIGILGSGDVGKTLGLGFIKSGHEIKVGTRDPSKLKEWLEKAGEKATAGSFKEAASFGEVAVLCCKGTAIEDVINSAGKESLSGKIVIDITNPLVFEKEGEAPKMGRSYPDSNGKKVKELLPEAKVSKAFNTVTAKYMANPKMSEGEPTLFIAGDQEAKEKVKEIASSWGWKDIIDAGNIEESYMLEAMTMLWINYGFMNNHWTHAFKLLKQ